jgi:hypothetical protein
MKVLWILCALVAVVRFQGADRCDPRPVPGRYAWLGKVMISDTEIARAQQALPYERIELSESSHPWVSDGFRLELRRDGSIVESGTSNRNGTVSIHDYGQLCWLIERSGFETMPNCASNGYDLTWFTVKVWHAGSREPVTVFDYGGVGSPDLWTLRTAIRGVESRASWK